MKVSDESHCERSEAIPDLSFPRKRESIKLVPLYILIALAMCLLPVKAYCDAKTVQPKMIEVTGEVSQVDSVGGVVFLKTIDALGVPIEMRFYVSNNGQGIEGSVHLMDLNVSDWVTIRYYVDSSGDNVLVKLTDDNIIKNPM